MIELIKSPVVFDEENHRYFLGEKELKGVTSTLIRRAFPDKYKDIDPEVLANAARKGKELHAEIEFHDNFQTSAEEHDDPRIYSYECIKQQYGLRTIANEYTVSDEENYASQIDIVMLNKSDEICLIDTKTTYSLDKKSAALQLSIYRRFFEFQNPNLKVAHIYVLWLPNKDTSIAELYELPFEDDGLINALMEADKEDKPFDIMQLYGTLPAQLASVEDEIVRMELDAAKIKERQAELKEGLYKIMTDSDIKSFRGSKILLTRVLPVESDIFDSARFKKENPELFEKYLKKSKRAGSLRITILDKSWNNGET